MTNRTFSKTLSANDVGATGGHQGGILIPKSEAELLSFLPVLDPKVKNPDAWIECEDETGTTRKFRFIYYNNKLHDEGGTRNEYRITYMPPILVTTLRLSRSNRPRMVCSNTALWLASAMAR
jgi:hypothetical protein